MGKKKDEATATAEAVEGPPAWRRYKRECAICGVTFEVNVPGSHGELTGTLGCPVCASRC